MDIKSELFICFKCKHFCANTNYETMGGCRAFPEGIPDGIGTPHSHDKVKKGQIGNYIYTPI